jgi:5-methyltetrahydrofolate--homocysteine methyltransferase
MDTVLRSASKEVVIGAGRPFCVIGERINPTGRRIFQEQLRRDDLSRIEVDVAQQVAGGAMVLDVNMGAPLADETELMVKAIKLIQSLTDLPLCLDSSIVEVLEAGLATYQGKALVNSVTAEDERLDAILPLVARHGAAVIGLPNDEEEIPEDPARRLELARKIIDTATGRYGIPVEDVLIDPLAMPIGADTSVVVRTLETLQLLREEFGVNSTLGASNVSFGMPDRAALVAAFLPMASAAGLTSAIMDARSPELVRAARACDVLLNRDEWGATWIAAHRASVSAAASANAAAAASTSALPARGDDPPEPPAAAAAAS